eukprot:6198420-Pleurochrysis_carterae.AAC.1
MLFRSSTVFKLNTKSGERKIIRRAKGYERQFRLNCWNCDVPMCYRCEDSAEAPLTYVLPEAMGTQADLYLQLYQVGCMLRGALALGLGADRCQIVLVHSSPRPCARGVTRAHRSQVPPCIQSTGPLSVRLALEVTPEQPKKAITHVNNAEVGVAVCAPAREGLANAEVLELMVRVRSPPSHQRRLAKLLDEASERHPCHCLSAIPCDLPLSAAESRFSMRPRFHSISLFCRTHVFPRLRSFSERCLACTFPPPPPAETLPSTDLLIHPFFTFPSST